LAIEPTYKLSDDETKELKIHGLKKTKFPYLYNCPYFEKPYLILLFYRTNHAWYYTTIYKNEITNYKNINNFNWILINVYETIEEILSHSEEKLEHHHELIIMWLKLSELKYM